MDFFFELDGWVQALIATFFTWGMTALGASLVFFWRGEGKRSLCIMSSGAAGIMLASAFFSLLLPAVEGCKSYPCLILTGGFILGGGLIILCDRVTKLFMPNEGVARSRAVMCLAVTVHNIPEGMAVGVAFGALSSGSVGAAAAIMLALGIGIQNFPEGSCVAFPLHAAGYSKFKSFFLGQTSGLVEIFAGVAGALAVNFTQEILPFALAFSAGAMVAVVCSELVPESFSFSKLYATLGVIGGFSLMMLLDLAFG